MKLSFEFESEIRILEKLQDCRMWKMTIELKEFIICDTLQGTSHAYGYVSARSGAGTKSTKVEGTGELDSKHDEVLICARKSSFFNVSKGQYAS